MRTSMDALRSMKRYVAENVLPGYEVRLSSEEGAFQRPFCRVAWTTPALLTGHGPFQTECRRTMNIVVWPAESASPDEGRAVAEDIVETLTLAFSMGLHQPSYARFRAHPMMVPLFDYSPVSQVVTITATSGTWNATVPGLPATSALAWNVSAANFKAALVTAGVLTGDVDVAGSAGGPFTVTFKGSRLGVNSWISPDATLLVGAGHGVTVTSVKSPKSLMVAAADSDRATTDFIRIVEPPSVGDIEDPDTELSRLIVADFRCQWMRAAGVPPGGATAVTVGQRVAP